MGVITRRKERASEALFRALISVEDFNAVLAEIEKNRSSKPSKMRELYRMLELCGIPFKEGQPYEYYREIVDAAASETSPAKPHISSNGDILDRIVHALYKQYKDYEKPEEYMLRLVNLHGNPKWRENTLRLRILKEFIEKGDYLDAADIHGKTVIQSYVKEKYHFEKKPETRDILEKLDDGIFYRIDSVCKEDRDELTVNFAKNAISQIVIKNDKTSADLFSCQDGSDVVAYLMTWAGEKPTAKSIKEKCETDGLPELLQWSESGLKALERYISEQFKTYMKLKGKYGLLKITDDLANGKFRAQGGTKKVLYLFAMVFDMTYYLDSEDVRRDDDTDIEINLFQKYYTNNLLRFITKAYEGKLDQFELDPSGQGINYKNFAEMIYLYYIRQNMEAVEKIRKSHEMIERVKKAGKGNMCRVYDGENRTLHYKNLPLEANAFSLNESEFEEFILKNYDCNTDRATEDGNTYMVGPLQVDTDQISAYKQYKAILEKLKEYSDQPAADLVGYGVWFTDVEALDYESMRAFDDVDPREFAAFKEMLRVANQFMYYVVDESFGSHDQDDNRAPSASVLSKKTALSVTSASDITRTSLLVAFYYYFNAKMTARDISYGELRHESFNTFYDKFKYEADKYLESAYYQPFSSRNLFDFILVISSYSYLK